MRVGEPVPAELLLAEVQDPHRVRLGDHVRGPTAIVFLRHFG